MHGPARDAALALCWLPLAAGVAAVQGHPHALAWALSAVLLLSLSHQPVTLALVYGDAARWREHRLLFAAAPLAAAAVVMLGLGVSLLAVAVVAGLWNAEHTLMQRYGITRVYGRKGGDDRGGLEKPMLVSWLAVAMAAVAANPRTPHYLAEVNVGEVNRQGIQLLARLRPEAILALVPAVTVAGVLTRRWVRAERTAPDANPAKWLYLGATAALVLVVCVDPVAGFAAYVGAHALEYFVIVRGATDRRAASGGGGLVGRLARSPVRASGFVAATSLAAVATLVVIERMSSFTVATALYLTVGALHIFYDGLIWKMRTPAVAHDLAVAPPPPALVAS
jgi:hypothetical protein